MRRPPPEAAEMRGFALVLVAFRGEEGQGRGLTRRFFSDFPARGGEASTEIASWELGAGLATEAEAEGEGQLLAAGSWWLGWDRREPAVHCVLIATYTMHYALYTTYMLYLLSCAAKEAGCA